jgi:hypothetical protein
VTSFNGRTGAVSLWIDDIICAGGAPIFSPRFQGEPRANTPVPTSNSTRLATTAFVATALENAVDLSGYAPLDSPAFSGVPTAPTAALGSATGQIATTAFVMTAVADSTTGVVSFNGRAGLVVLDAADITGATGALLASPAFTGTPTAPTAVLGTSTGQLATTAFVQAAVSSVTSGVTSFNTRTGPVTLVTSDISGAGGALVASTVASFNGRTGAVSLLANDVSAVGGALVNSPAFTGTPTAPTPTAGDNSTRIATTAFLASYTGFAPIASPNFTGTPTAPTAAVGTNSTQLATTAFVLSEISASTAGVSSFNGRNGAVTLIGNDLTAAGGALLASPPFTGSPTAPTATAGTATTQLATTAFVMAAIGVAAFLPLTGGTLTGNLAVAAATPQFILNKPASGTAALLSGQTNGLTRWVLVMGNGAVESGANVGSDFALQRYADNGTILGSTVLSITRSTGLVSFPGQVFLSGGFFSGSATVGAINNANGMNYAPLTGLVTENTNNPALYTNKIGGNGTVHSIMQGGVGVGSISVTNGNATQFNTSSDIRLKADERGFDAGPIIDQIEVYDFAWKSGGRSHGVMAQETVEVYPAAVTHDEPTDWWGVDYSKFVALLLNEVKALRLRVAALEAA